MSQAGSFEFSCPTPGCGHRYRVTPDLVGKTIQCKSCKQKVKISAASNPPAASSTPQASRGRAIAAGTNAGSTGSVSAARATATPRPVSTRPASPAAQAAPAAEQFHCPHCRSECRIRPEWRGMTLQCPSCQKRFVVPQAKPASAPTAVVEPDAGFFVEDDAAEDSAPVDAYAFDEEPVVATLLPDADDSESFGSRTNEPPRKKRSKRGSGASVDLSAIRPLLKPAGAV